MRSAYQLRIVKYRNGAARLGAIIALAILAHPDAGRLFFELSPARWLIYCGFGILAAVINRPNLLPRKEGYILLAAMFMGLLIADLRFDWAALIIWLPMSFSDFFAGKIDTFGVRIGFLFLLVLAAFFIVWGIRFDPLFTGFIESRFFVAAWIFGMNGLTELGDKYGEHIPSLANRHFFDLGCLVFVLLLSRPGHEINVFLLFMTYALFYRSTNLMLLLTFRDRVLDDVNHTSELRNVNRAVV
jgi:hypothetical protein